MANTKKAKQQVAEAEAPAEAKHQVTGKKGNRPVTPAAEPTMPNGKDKDKEESPDSLSKTARKKLKKKRAADIALAKAEAEAKAAAHDAALRDLQEAQKKLYVME